MTLMSEIHKREISELLMQTYWKILGPYSDEECKNGFMKIIKTLKFFPKPNDLIESIKGKGIEEDRALEAFLEVWNALKNSMGYKSAKFTDDPVIHNVIQAMGGLPFIAENWFYEDMQWIEKEFIKLYKQFAKRKKHPEYIQGIYEIENSAKGYPVEQPKIIRSQRAIEKEEEEKKPAIEDKSKEMKK